MSAKFVMCINNKAYPRDLALRKVYKDIATEQESLGGWVRVVDETGEDYLYPTSGFVPVQLPVEAEQSFELATA